MKNNNGETPLYVLCTHNNLEFVSLLLEYSARVNVMTYFGQSILEKSLSLGFMEIADILVEYAADVACKDDSVSPSILLP